jgi:glutathione-independent formaldehyde dehydrogenase
VEAETCNQFYDNRSNNKEERAMADNRVIAYMGPRKLEMQSLDYPKLVGPGGRKCDHGVILKLVATNICGSDQHIYRGRFPAPQGMVLGHEMTGQVVELGRDVEFIKQGDLCSVPFNVSCGRCRNCMERHTDVCMNVNDQGVDFGESGSCRGPGPGHEL